MNYITFVDIAKNILGERFEVLCNDWKPSRTMLEPELRTFENYGKFFDLRQQGILIANESEEYFLRNDKQIEIEDRFYDIDRSLRILIRRKKLHCYRKYTDHIPTYEETDAESVYQASRDRCYFLEHFETIEEFLRHFYPGIYFDENEICNAVEDWKTIPENVKSRMDTAIKELAGTTLEKSVNWLKENEYDPCLAAYILRLNLWDLDEIGEFFIKRGKSRQAFSYCATSLINKAIRKYNLPIIKVNS